ncbi:MAG: hypothetical protein LH618_03310 [Saprospiraceae bacterium]|nr:hypothetical protein [Saprospiraceae bacterium]
MVLPAVNSSSRSNSVIFMHQIIDNGDGAPLGMYLPGMGSMMLKASIGGESGKDRMTEKTLKKMVEDFGKVSDDGQEEEEESKN